MVREDVPSAVAILENSLGIGFVSEEELAGYLTQPEKVAYVAAAGTEVVGVATGILPKLSMSLYAMIPEDQQARVEELVPELTDDGSRNGLLKSVAVDPRSRGTGVGTQVSAAVVNALLARGATGVLSIGWTDDDGCHIQKTLESLGFKSRGDLPDFWQQDSIIYGYSCPTCGHPCECTARIFLL